MRSPRLAWLALACLLLPHCASSTVATSPVYPFGPERYTISATTTQAPDKARSGAIAAAAAFCRTRGQRSLPVDVVLVTTPVEIHCVTVVFTCYSPDGIGNLEQAI